MIVAFSVGANEQNEGLMKSKGKWVRRRAKVRKERGD